ncbi:MAG: hypothetical protein ACRD2X_12960 [Vicinamibacteraceae bacterium]
MNYKLAAIALALVGLGAPQPASAQADGATPITDPRVLRSMGFAPNAENVYMDNAVGLAITADQEDAVTAEITPQVTPTTGTDYSTIAAKEFVGRIDTTGTQWRYATGPSASNFELSRVGTELFAEAQFEVPTGATLRFFRTWAFDTSASSIGYFVFEVCQPGFAGGAPVFSVIAFTSTSGTPGNTSNVVSLNRAVNNRDCTYLARVRFDAASTNLALQKVRLQFTR